VLRLQEQVEPASAKLEDEISVLGRDASQKISLASQRTRQ
jgi:hypothetical protein